MHFTSLCPTTISFQLIFSKFTPYISQTKVFLPSYFQCSEVPFLATKGPSLFFLYVPYNPQFSTIFSKFAPHFKRTSLQTPVCFDHRLVTFVTTRGQSAFFLYVPYIPQFSNDLFQIFTNYSLDHTADSSSFLVTLSYICGHQGANIVFLVCALQYFVFNRPFTNWH